MDGNDVKITQIDFEEAGASETVMTAADAQMALGSMWRIEGNNLMKRMGELRSDKEAAQGGVWARYYRGELSATVLMTVVSARIIQPSRAASTKCRTTKAASSIQASRQPHRQQRRLYGRQRRPEQHRNRRIRQLAGQQGALHRRYRPRQQADQ